MTPEQKVKEVYYHGGFTFASAEAWGELRFHAKTIEMRTPRGWVIFEIPVKDIASVEVTSKQVAKSKAGAVVAFGVFGLGAKGAEELGTLLVHMKSGQTGYFTVRRGHEARLLGMLSPWLLGTGIPIGPPPGPPPTTQAPSPISISVADEIAKLAVLRDRGILTEEEFKAQKARLLGG